MATSDQADKKQTKKPSKKKDEKPWLYKKGQSGNPAGRPKGVKTFKTMWREAVKKIAAEDKQTVDDKERELVRVGLEKALEGEYNFYRDTFDRNYGKPVQPTDITSGGEAIAIPSEVMGKYDITRNSEDSSEKPSEVQGGKLRKKVGKDDSGD